MIPLFKVYMGLGVSDQVARVLRSGYLAQGPRVDEFEQMLSEHFNNHPHVATTNSCTSAIHLAARILKDELGRDECEVIASPLTCTAGLAPFQELGFRITWADIDPTDMNICLKDVESKLTERTRVLTFVHWGGYPVDYDKLNLLKNRYKAKYGQELYVVEDCAHAWGSTYLGYPLGATRNNFAAYSCQAIKTVTTGDGGVLLSPNARWNDKARKLRWFGLDRDNKQDFRACQDIIDVGYKFHMNDIAATIGICNLPYMNYLIRAHRRVADLYNTQIKNVSVVIPQCTTPLGNPSHWLYTLRVGDRDRFVTWMADKGISCSQVHVRNDKLTCFQQHHRSLAPLNNMNMIEEQYVCIPCGWWLDNSQIKRILEAVNGYDN